MREPTADECTAHAPVELGDGRTGVACWYPQMGGYSGKAVAVVDKPGNCTDVLVWHDGDFPFTGDPIWGDEREPVTVHHCDGEQFIGFGEFLAGLRDG